MILPAFLCLAASAILSESFDDPRALEKWESGGAGKSEWIDGALKVTVPAQGDHLVSIDLPVEEIRGRRVSISARMKLEDVVKAPEPWHGGKLMLQTESPDGPKYQGAPQLSGSWNWREVGMNADVPENATRAQLRLGLGQARGTAWFDDITVQVTAQPRVSPANPPSLLPPEKLDRRTDIPRLRGVMYGPKGREEDIRELARWKGNLIRWQFYWHGATDPAKRLDLAEYDRWLDETMAEVDRMLPLCHELGISVVIDLHTPPGGADAGQMEIFAKPEFQAKFVEVWDRLVKHYRNEPAVWAYDLLNEPAEGRAAEGLRDWRQLSELVARRIRAADFHKAIIVEPGPYGGWDNLPYFSPLDIPGIIYSGHMYEPMRFTHQGVLDGFASGVRYPGEIEGKTWNKEALRKVLEPLRQYQKDYNVPIYIGEFSAPRWAPEGSAAAWLADCIALFEEYGWDWSYHAWREWQGWNPELGSDPKDETTHPANTDRSAVLKEGFSRNDAAKK